eukprot:jgi/Botrbrau1/2887/Bobra.0036s0029.1
MPACKWMVLCYVPRGPVQGCHVGGLVRQGLVNQLESMQRLLMARGGPVSVRALHFHPPGVPHPVTALYPLPPDHFPPVCLPVLFRMPCSAVHPLTTRF